MIEPAVPKRIGRYEVERLLGQGGMGRVWLARDTVLGRRVAIKVLRDDLALPPSVQDELVLRMRHEAQAAAAVSHPNIVTLHDMGEDGAVGLYLVFEYVPGPGQGIDGGEPESLRDRLKDGPLTFGEVARLARELGAALSFAHEAGVIHRDIKPENVLFSRTGAKIADFGIARIPDSTLTRANTVLGTPAYTAPEALSKGTFGPLSDQFSLAATLYEAATASRAFGGDDAIITAGKVSSEPAAPLHESLGPESIVRALDATLRRGLDKEAAMRFPSCADLGDAVARATETKSPEIIEIERTPLSSRVAMTGRLLQDLPHKKSDTPHPSIYIRRQTHRFQNIAVAAALLVIVVLVLIGRKTSTPSIEDESSPGLDPVHSAAPTSSAITTPPAKHTPKPKPSVTTHAASASASAPSASPTDAGPPDRDD